MSKIETNTIDTVSGTTNLTIGSTNTSTITMPNGKLTGHMYPAFEASDSSSFQTLTASTTTKLTFDTEVFDEGGDYDAANSKFVCSVAGKYYFTYKFEGYSGNSTLQRTGALIYKNGVSQYGTQTYFTSSGSIVHVMNQNYILDLVATDYVEIYGILQVGSGTTNRIYFKEFMGYRIGA